MSVRSLLLAALVLSLPLVASAADPPGLKGAWKPAEAELAGQKFPEPVLKSMKLVMEDGKYVVHVGDKLDKGEYKLDAAAKPATIDITGVEGPNKGKTLLAIWRLDGDTLHVCYDLTGKNRPTEFKSEKDTQIFLVKYQRAE